MKAAVVLVGRVMVLTIVLFICISLAAGVVGQPPGASAPEPAGSAAFALVIVCVLDTIVLTHFILRSRWTGWRLAAAVFFVFYGVSTFMPQIESAVFITRLPAGMLPRLFVMGVLFAAPFAVVAVLILGKWKRTTSDVGDNSRLVMPRSEWTWRLAVIAVVYVILYFTFGYFIAWKNPAVREYYSGSDPGGFFTQMGTVVRDTPWLIPFQILRAMLWTLLALPVIRSMKGSWPETALSVGLLFAVLMSALLLLPNPYMPESVRMSHLVETATSNFIFGVFIGWLLTRGEGRKGKREEQPQRSEKAAMVGGMA
jgi:Ca2+/Na+ antiporter